MKVVVKLVNEFDEKRKEIINTNDNTNKSKKLIAKETLSMKSKSMFNHDTNIDDFSPMDTTASNTFEQVAASAHSGNEASPELRIFPSISAAAKNNNDNDTNDDGLGDIDSEMTILSLMNSHNDDGSNASSPTRSKSTAEEKVKSSQMTDMSHQQVTDDNMIDFDNYRFSFSLYIFQDFIFNLMDKNGRILQRWIKNFDEFFIDRVTKKNYNYYLHVHESIKYFIMDITNDIYDYITSTDAQTGENGGADNNDKENNDSAGQQSNDRLKGYKLPNVNEKDQKVEDVESKIDNSGDITSDFDKLIKYLNDKWIKTNDKERKEMINDRKSLSEDFSAISSTQACTDKKTFETTPLAQVMSINQCSGHCDNNIMKFSLSLYSSVLDGELPVSIFNKNTHAKDACNFWQHLLNKFIKSDSDSDGKNDDDCNQKSTDRVEWIKEIIYLIKRMFDSLDWFSFAATSPARAVLDYVSHKSSNPNDIEWVNMLTDTMKKVNNQSNELDKIVEDRIKRMFFDWGKVHDKYLSQNCTQPNASEMDWLLNKLLLCILYHHYFGVSYQPDVVPMILKSNLDTKEIGSYFVRGKLGQYLWTQLDKAMYQQLTATVSSNQDFMLSRYIVLVTEFLVECEATTGTNIHCCYAYDVEKNSDVIFNDMGQRKFIHSKYKDYSAAEVMMSRLCQEIILGQFKSQWAMVVKKAKEIFDCERNVAMKEKLSILEIAAIYMWTLNSVSNHIKQVHRLGETCKYRYMCQYIMNGLTKLKKYDLKSKLQSSHPYDLDISNLKYLYMSLSNVTFKEQADTPVKSKSSMINFIKKYCNTNEVNINPMQYCVSLDTLTSTNVSPMTATKLSNLYFGSNKAGIVLRISAQQIIDNIQIIAADISWISAIPGEQEVLVTPCLIWIFPIGETRIPPEFLDAKKQYVKENSSNKDSEIFGAEFRPLGRVSMLKQIHLSKQKLSQLQHFGANTEQAQSNQSVIQCCNDFRRFTIKMAKQNQSEKNNEFIDKVRKVISRVQYDVINGNEHKVKFQIVFIKDIYHTLKNGNDEKSQIDEVFGLLKLWDSPYLWIE